MTMVEPKKAALPFLKLIFILFLNPRDQKSIGIQISRVLHLFGLPLFIYNADQHLLE